MKGHYLREVTPDVFANNRMSSLLDTGKTLSQLRDAWVSVSVYVSPQQMSRLLTAGAVYSPEKKYDNTHGVASYVGVMYVDPGPHSSST